MNVCQVSFLALFIVTPMAFGGTPQSASSDAVASQLHSVTVTADTPAQPVRVDVRTVCPDIDKELQNSLSSAWGRVHETGSMQVRFHLEGKRVSEVRSTGAAAWSYRPYIRSSVAKLDCSVATETGREFTFLLVIRGPEGHPDLERTAMLHR
jgi:hypothetical protein